MLQLHRDSPAAPVNSRIDPPSLLTLPPLVGQIESMLPEAAPIYLVGGAVRDALLQRPTYDLDFAVNGDALRIARQMADALEGAYFAMDAVHGTGRVILTPSAGARFILDFTRFRGATLEEDLRARDFTVNAMAISLGPEREFYDPLGGSRDLKKKALRACAPDAFVQDPLRILRGVRLAVSLRFQLLPDTRQWMRAAASQLPQVSAERLRDELFRILEGPHPAAALQALDILGALVHVLPELSSLKAIPLNPGGVDAWKHTVRALQKLEDLLEVLGTRYDPGAAADLALAIVVMRLGRYRREITEHLTEELSTGRSARGLLFLATLYHEVGKAEITPAGDEPDLQYSQHAGRAAAAVKERARQLRLSVVEQAHLARIAQGHVRPALLSEAPHQPTRRAIYRFFRDLGPAGVDVCLLSLADFLALHAPAVPQDRWERHVEVIRGLLEAWWEHRSESIDPPEVLNGDDLIRVFGLEPGPRIGRLLEALREAQACGQIREREEALQLARTLLKEDPAT